MPVLVQPLRRQGYSKGGIIHYVTFGEGLSGIAAKYGVTVEAILRHNGLTNPDLIYVGQPLIIPTAYGSSGYAGSAGGYGCGNYHIVSAGETLSSIAFNYNSSVQELLRQNNLYNKDTIYVGQKLCVPGRGRPWHLNRPATPREMLIVIP